MLRRYVALLIVGLIANGMAYAAPSADMTKDFADYHCRLSLPGSTDFEWLDHTQIPQAAAALRNSSGTTVLLLVTKVPSDFTLNTKGFDDGLCAPGVASKLKSEKATFRGVPCYQICVRFEQNNAIAAIRAFAANGFLYQVQIIGESLPIDDQSKLEHLFSMFEFIGSPATTVAKAPSSEQKAYNFSRLMGRLVGICLIAIIVLVVAKRMFGKKKGTS